MDKSTFTNEILNMERSLYHVAKTILKRDSDCEDAVQEAILKAYTKLDTLRQEKFFKSWVTRILLNECYKISNARKKTVPLEDYHEDKNTPSEDSSLDVYEAICCLKENIRVTIVLFYIEGYSIKEISGILRIPEGTVKSRLSTGRKLMKCILQRGKQP